MTSIHPIDSAEQLARLVDPYLRRKHFTNDYVSVEKYRALIKENRLSYVLSGAGNGKSLQTLYILADMDSYYRMWYHLTYAAELLDIKKPVTTEVVYKNGDIVESELLRSINFKIAAQRRRMTAKTGISAREATVITANKTHCYRITELLNDHFDLITGFIPAKKDITKMINNGGVLCVEISGKVAGILLFEREGVKSLMTHLAVDQEFRGRGFATQLLNAWKTFELQAKSYVLWVAEENTEAIRLYERAGFEFDGYRSTTFTNNG